MSELVIFEGDKQPVEVRLEGETVWLTQRQMAELFDKDVRTINEHVGNVYAEGEVEREPTIRNFRTVPQEGSRHQKNVFDSKALDRDRTVAKNATVQREAKDLMVRLTMNLLSSHSPGPRSQPEQP